jgi:hypothetical protein
MIMDGTDDGAPGVILKLGRAMEKDFTLRHCGLGLGAGSEVKHNKPRQQLQGAIRVCIRLAFEHYQLSFEF